MHTWTPRARELRLGEQSLPQAASTPTAFACSGGLLRASPTTPEQRWHRLAPGQPVSALTRQLLTGGCDRLAALDTRALWRVGNHASWHTSPFVCTGRRAPHRHVKQPGRGVRLVTGWLPRTSPWLNPIEPTWLHRTRAGVEPARVRTAPEVAARVCAAYEGSQEAHLSISEKAA
jgi:hypothetical protein